MIFIPYNRGLILWYAMLAVAVAGGNVIGFKNTLPFVVPVLLVGLLGRCWRWRPHAGVVLAVVAVAGLLIWAATS
jgi:hypothetical protein